MIGFSGRYWPQLADEFGGLVAFLQSENIQSYLEVGALNGDTAHALGIRAKLPFSVTAIDIEPTEQLRKSLADLESRGISTSLIEGDSRAQSVLNEAARLGPYDFAFIDGDHSETAALYDWVNFSTMAHIIGFHDIDALNFQVRPVWQSIKKGRRHIEIIGRTRGAGIGIVWVSE